MRIFRITCNNGGCGGCGGYGKPKGHLDTQMFPECKGTPCDRDVVKKYRKRKKQKKSASSLIEHSQLTKGHVNNQCPFCDDIQTCRCPTKIHPILSRTNFLCNECEEAKANKRYAKKDDSCVVCNMLNRGECENS